MSFTKYLERFAEAEARSVELDDLRAHGPWAHAITIPARREGVECLHAVAAPAARGPVLVVLVVNAGDDGEDRRVNAALIAELEARAAGFDCGPGLRFFSSCRARDPRRMKVHGPLGGGAWQSAKSAVGGLLDVLLVDRSGPPNSFGPRDGVGLARKIGADLIVRLIDEGLVGSPWVHTTDADVELPAEHFDRVAELDTASISAAVAPFRHVDAGDPQTHAATLRYELSLRYYVLGLRSAGSAYAFHSIGSLISVAAPRYVQARGFPRRRAGEDFYMLDKLAKLAPIARLSGDPVAIRSRRSARAPFGTGPAVEALLSGKPHEVYDPRVFEVLGRANRALESGDALPELPELDSWREGARMLIERYPATQRRERMREHFDGFRTLKLIHALTERWPKLAWAQAVSRAAFIQLDERLSLADQRERLAKLEGDEGS